MLWSLLKIVVFVVLVAAGTVGAGYLLDTGGNIRISVASTEYTLSPLAAVILALVTLGAIWILFRATGFLVALFRFFNGDETALSRFFNRNRERRGFQALADGLMALASGEGRLALSKAAKAERYLRRPELTNLISAQAAEMAGDRTKAEQVYKRLLKDDRTRFVGVRGIMKQKLADGDMETAFRLAEKAFALKPKHEDTQDVLLRLQADREDWTGARNTLAAKLKSGALPRDVHKRRDAVLAYSEATEALEDGNTEKALSEAIEANRLAPTLVPAAAFAARMYTEAGKRRYAIRLLKTAWGANPHPDLAAAFAEIEPNESPTARIDRFQTLTKLNPDHPETRLLLAELNIAAEDFPAARKALGDLCVSDPTTRSLTIMAAIERGEGVDDAVVRGWLAKAVTASRGPQWTCDNCHHIHGTWVPVCANCGAFDTLTWQEPPKSEAIASRSAEMLPLIVGSLEDKSEDAEVILEPEPNEQTTAEFEDAEEVAEASLEPDTRTPEPTADEAQNRASAS